MKLLSIVVAAGMFVAGLVALVDANAENRDTLPNELGEKAFTYVAGQPDGSVKVYVMKESDDPAKVCAIAAEYPHVRLVEVYNRVTEQTVDCK